MKKLLFSQVDTIWFSPMDFFCIMRGSDILKVLGSDRATLFVLGVLRSIVLCGMKAEKGHRGGSDGNLMICLLYSIPIREGGGGWWIDEIMGCVIKITCSTQQ